MKYFNCAIITILALMMSSCSSDETNNENPDNDAKLLKQVTWNTGYSEKYFYDSESRLELIVSNEYAFTGISPNDSTYIEYQNGHISKILERDHTFSEIINDEKLFLNFTSTVASGTRKIFTDSGQTYMEQTFEFKFAGNLLKSYTTFNLNENVHFFQEYTHNAAGNLTEWNEISYDSSNGQIVYENNNAITQWDQGNHATEKLFMWDSITLPGFYLSNNNCLNLIDETPTTYHYTFEYDVDGYVTKYTLDNGDFITLDYY
ncbi:MAG: hypothetical protein KDD03_00300 [Gelidibacter sp.]|nr:hypothetical protein [Gelidibacter sp.]